MEHQHTKECRGFTLIEVIVVMVTMTIMAGFAVPQILAFLPNIRLKSAAMDLYTNMQSVRLEAVKSNHDWAIVFTPATNKYYLCSAPGTSWNTLADTTVERTVDLADYKSGVKFGHGSVAAGSSATTPPAAFPAGDISYTGGVLIFSPKGIGTAGWVYLDNEDNTAYAVGTQTSGVVMVRRWKAGGWQ